MDNNFNNEDPRSCAPSDCASCPGCTEAFPDEMMPPTITLTMDDDTEVECSILTVFPADGNDYIALLPLDENGQNLEGEVYLYRFSMTEDGSPELSNIESDAEYETAGKAFDAIVEKAIAAENE